MSCLAETNPQLVKAAREALEIVEPTGADLSRETTFIHDGHTWWTKMTIDPHANIIEKWDILPWRPRH